METKSLKTMARKVLERNQEGNLTETKSFHRGVLAGGKVSKVSNENTAYCYWLKNTVDECLMPCFEISATTVIYECPNFKHYWDKKRCSLPPVETLPNSTYGKP